MLSRRSLLGGAATLASLTAARSAAVLTEDGLYSQPWFLESLLELADDLSAATERRKKFAVLWELKGCPYCKDTHLINFARPEVETYIKDRFDILQLNIIGAREVVDFDGEKISEKRLAEKYGVRFTPTLQFFPESIDGLAKKKPRDREVARLQGYLEPRQFLATFRFVAERAYETGTLADYLKRGS